MPDLDDALNEATVVGSEEDSTDYLEIGHTLRTIEIPVSKAGLLGVVSDEKVNTLHFKCPRYYENVDLGDFSFRINYTNALNNGDMYLVTDKIVRENEIEFSWTVGRHAFVAAGNVTFVVCAKLTDGNGEVVKEYNTARHILPVAEGLETSEAIDEDERDIIEELISMVSAMSPGSSQATIQTATISASGWSGDGPYTHSLSLSGITNNSKVNVQADQNAISALKADGVTSLWVQNNNSVLTLYATGGQPDSDVSLQFTIDVFSAGGGSSQDVSGKIDVTEKGVANGVAELDEDGKVPLSQLPFTIIEVNAT